MENEEFDLKLDPNLTGAPVRDHLVKLQNLFGSFNQEHDDALIEYERQKLLLDLVTEKVAEVIADKPYIPGSKIKAKLKVEVILEDGTVHTIAKVKTDLIDIKKRYNEAKSKLNELKSAINVTRSALVWDRAEYSET